MEIKRYVGEEPYFESSCSNLNTSNGLTIGFPF